MKLTLRRATLQTPGARDARRSWPERERLLIRIAEPSGLFGLGEAAPLPGYSPDGLDEVESALLGVDPYDLADALARELRDAEPHQVMAALSDAAKLVPEGLPSARMALETASLDYLARLHDLPAPRLFGAAPNAFAALAFLAGPASEPSLIERARAAVQAGFSHLKLKVGAPGRLAEELAGVSALRAALGPDVRLRLDANGVLSASELLDAWGTLESLDIELFEEPGSLPDSLVADVPLAFDESLQGLDENAVADAVQRRCARCVVLKPTALGGLAHCWRLAQRAQREGAGVVISHCFEGSLAFRAAAALALALPGGLAHGLAPHAGVASAALPVHGGKLHAWSEPGLGEPEAFE